MRGQAECVGRQDQEEGLAIPTCNPLDVCNNYTEYCISNQEHQSQF